MFLLNADNLKGEVGLLSCSSKDGLHYCFE
nr:MAG TPA: hypothetical protein [Caudoviricetes sp.]